MQRNLAIGTRFNTSHVTLYRWFRQLSDKGYKVSIHLMLLFIEALNIVSYPTKSFNTSHVTLYPIDDFAIDGLAERFNTSHVTLYHNRYRDSAVRQYCFNTSHVTLHRRHAGQIFPVIQVSIHLMLLFIYNQIAQKRL